MSHSKLNINPWIGKVFLVPSGNLAKLHRIGPGMLGLQWSQQPSEADIAIFEKWLEQENGDREMVVHTVQESDGR